MRRKPAEYWHRQLMKSFRHDWILPRIMAQNEQTGSPVATLLNQAGPFTSKDGLLMETPPSSKSSQTCIVLRNTFFDRRDVQQTSTRYIRIVDCTMTHSPFYSRARWTPLRKLLHLEVLPKRAKANALSNKHPPNSHQQAVPSPSRLSPRNLPNRHCKELPPTPQNKSNPNPPPHPASRAQPREHKVPPPAPSSPPPTTSTLSPVPSLPQSAPRNPKRRR